MVNVLFVQLPDTVCVVPAAQITSLGIDSGDVSSDARFALLEDLLETPAANSTRAARTLVVMRGDQKTVFKTLAELRLGEIAEDHFFNLPSVLRASTCRPWVRGLVTLPEKSSDALGVWLDIHELADTVWGELHDGEQP